MKVPTLSQTPVMDSFTLYKGQAENALYGISFSTNRTKQNERENDSAAEFHGGELHVRRTR
jgi:hypothetical protein